MSNLLNSPSLFTNGVTSTKPPASWNGAFYSYNNNDGEVFLNFTGIVGNADYFGASVTNLDGTPVHLHVGIDGEEVQYIIDVETSFELDTDVFPPGSTVTLRLSSTAEDGSIRAEIYPAEDVPKDPWVDGEEPEAPETYVLKGFVVMSSMADNAVGEVSVLGELSSRAYSYAREKGHYKVEDYSAVELVSFKSHSVEEGMVPVPFDVADNTLELTQWIYDQSIAGTIPQVEDELIQNLYSQFADSGLSNIRIGEFVSEGQYVMPSWVAWKINRNDNMGTASVKVWLADDAFRRQYDEYEIIVVPATTPIDNFFADYNTVNGLVSDFNMPALTLAVEAAAGIYPYTLLRTILFDWITPNNESLTIPTPWSVIIYGIAGNNIDVIKTKLREWILANSTRTREDWIAIFPDIFRSTEFIITPLWSQYSIPNKTLQSGLYSPVIQPAVALELAEVTAHGYPPAHVAAVLSASVFMYKSLGFLSVGGPENRDEIYTFYEKFVDYIAVPTDSADFNRMDPITQGWIMMITEMLLIAEEMTEFSDIPVGMTRMKRGNVLYVVSSYQDVQYLVVAKKFVESLVIEVPEEGV